MSILHGRAGMLAPRDHEIFLDLFLCRYLTTQQIAQMYFGSRSAARCRLYKLQQKGWITSSLFLKPPRHKIAYWRLTKDGFDVMADELGTRERWTPKQLKPSRIEHHLDTSDLYVAVKPLLDHHAGPHPAWQWLHEARAFKQYEQANRQTTYRPDAEIHWNNCLFIIERQTNRKNAAFREIDEKVKNHKVHIDYDLKEGTLAGVVFACDHPRDVEAARIAGQKYHVNITVGTVLQAAEGIKMWVDEILGTAA